MLQTMKRFALLALLLLSVVSLSAQRRIPSRNKIPQQTISIEGQGGLGALRIDGSLGIPTKMGVGAGAAVGYTFMFNRSTGIHTGLAATYLSSGYATPEIYALYPDDITTYNNTTTFDGICDIRATTANIEENYTALLLSVPLQLVWLHNTFEAKIGARVAFPLSVNAAYVYGATSRGIIHIYNTDTELAEPIPLSSEYTLPATSGSYSAPKGLLVNFVLEAGFRIPKSKTNSIYIGGFLDYGLNSIATSSDVEFATFAAGGDFQSFNGALASKATSSFSDFSIGLKFAYNFHFGRNLK